MSELVERIRAKARAKRASHLELLRVLADGTHERMVSGDEAEAARGNFVYPFFGQAERKKNKGERKHAGSSSA